MEAEVEIESDEAKWKRKRKRHRNFSGRKELNRFHSAQTEAQKYAFTHC